MNGTTRICLALKIIYDTVFAHFLFRKKGKNIQSKTNTSVCIQDIIMRIFVSHSAFDYILSYRLKAKTDLCY